MTQLKVATNSVPSKVAGAIANIIRNEGKVCVSCIGPSAVNQGVKAIAIASGFVAPIGIEMVCKPSFGEVEVEGDKRTCINLICSSI